MNVANNIYKWSSSRGDLYLLNQSNDYRWEYEAKNEQRHIIPNSNVMGIPLRMLSENVHNIFQEYFFSVQQKDGQRFIKFFESVHLDDFEYSNSIEPKSLVGNIGFEFNKLEAKKHIEFSAAAPSYRRVARGLNLQARCLNKICEAYKKFVVIPKGIGEFRIAEEMDDSSCPACDTPLQFDEVNNLGFWNCTYTIKGKQTQPEEKNVERTDTAEARNYTTFKNGYNCHWAYLKVTTSVTSKGNAEASNSSGCILL